LTGGNVTWSDAFDTETCVFNEEQTIISINSTSTNSEWLNVSPYDLETIACRIFDTGSVPKVEIGLSTEETTACMNSLKQIAENDGVECTSN
jgi:hypothetical protein